MRALLSTYFEIDDVIDVSINVQKSVIKQRDRRQDFMARSSHYQLVIETINQINSQFRNFNSAVRSSLAKKSNRQKPLTAPHLFNLHGEDAYNKLQGNQQAAAGRQQ